MGGRCDVKKHIVNTVCLKSSSIQRLALLCPEIFCNILWFCGCWFQQRGPTCHCVTETIHLFRDLYGASLIARNMLAYIFP
jgi:hypothetical protein